MMVEERAIMPQHTSSRQTLHFLLDWRLHRRLSLRQLSKLSGITVTTIHSLERLQSQANLVTIARLAAGLGTTVDGILQKPRDNAPATELEGKRRATA